MLKPNTLLIFRRESFLLRVPNTQSTERITLMIDEWHGTIKFLRTEDF